MIANNTHKDTFLARWSRLEILEMQKNDDALDILNRKDVFSNTHYKSFESLIVLKISLKAILKNAKTWQLASVFYPHLGLESFNFVRALFTLGEVLYRI